MNRAAARAYEVRPRRGGMRGFTLTELMAVVAITGILGAVAVRALRQRALESDVASAQVVVKSIAAAEEQYRAENQLYLNVSTFGESGWYPRKTPPRNARVNFWRTPPGDTSDAESVRWRVLAPDIRQPVSFGFKANAGLPDKAPVFEAELASGTVPTLVEPWYLIQARADADEDGIGCMVGAASWTPVVFSINDGE